MTICRSGSGLGDSIYLRAIAEYLVRRGDSVVALTDYPAVFIGSGATTEAFRRHKPLDIVAHYTTRKQYPETSQFADMCINAGLNPAKVPLAITWEVRNRPLVDGLRAKARGRPIILVHGGRSPMARTDGFGAELLPRREVFDAVLDLLRDCFLVRVGKGPQIYPLQADVDMSDETTVADIMDLGATCDGAVSQCCFMIPLAESLGKPLLTVWAAAGLHSPEQYIRAIKPEKILSRQSSRYVIDDWPMGSVQVEVANFRSALSIRRVA